MNAPTIPPRVMRGADGSNAGASGYVPAPAASDNVKLLHGDGTFKAVTNASAATDAQAAAGTNSTTFLTPANGVLASVRGLNSRAARDMLYFDGMTSSARAYWPLGTAGDGLGSGKLTKVDIVEIPSANPSSAAGIWALGPGNSSYDSPTASWSLSLYLSTSGGLVVQINSGDPNYYIRSLTLASVVTNYGGQLVRLGITWDGASAPILYLNGVAQTMSETTSGGGSAPAWTQAVSDDYVLQGRKGQNEYWKGILIPGPIINTVLTAAEMLSHAQTGKLPSWCDVGSGSMVAIMSPSLLNGGFETAGGGGADIWGTWTETNVTGTGALADETSITNSGSHAAKMTTGASGMAGVRASIGLVPGRKYRIEFYARDDGNNATLTVESDQGNYGTAVSALTNVYTKYSFEFVANSGAVIIKCTQNNKVIYIDDVTILAVGPLYRPIIQPIAVVADTGSNKIAGVLTSGITPITEKRDWVIQAMTNTNGNQQLLGASVFFDSTRHVIDDWCMNTTGTPTVTAGSASAGTQYKSSGALAATRNLISLVTRVLASANLWCGSNDTSTIYHTVRGHIVD